MAENFKFKTCWLKIIMTDYLNSLRARSDIKSECHPVNWGNTTDLISSQDKPSCLMTLMIITTRGKRKCTGPKTNRHTVQPGVLEQISRQQVKQNIFSAQSEWHITSCSGGGINQWLRTACFPCHNFLTAIQLLRKKKSTKGETENRKAAHCESDLRAVRGREQSL